MTQKIVKDELKRLIKKFKSQVKAAEYLEISQSYLSMVLNDERDPNEELLKKLDIFVEYKKGTNRQ